MRVPMTSRRIRLETNSWLGNVIVRLEGLITIARHADHSLSCQTARKLRSIALLGKMLARLLLANDALVPFQLRNPNLCH